MQSTLASMSQVYEKTDQNLVSSSQPKSSSLSLTRKLKMPFIMHKSTTLYQTFEEKLVSKEKNENEKQSINTQDIECKLFTLHSRLRQEAEKMREWKLSTEDESKQKEKKIGELTQTTENLRKSFIEVQIENEHLSLKMQEEISNREEILKKIDFTRKMCNIVKEHSQTVENKVMQCEAESNELKYKEREYFEKFEELTVKFNYLNISAKEEENKLNNEINNIILEKEKQRKGLEKRIEDMRNVIEELHNEISCRNEKMEQLNKDLHDAEEEKNRLLSDYEESKKCLSEVEFKYTTLKFESTEKSNDASLIKTSLESLLKEANEAYEKLEKEHGELNVKYISANKIIENLKSDKDMLVLEKAELSENLKQEMNQKNNLQTQLNSKSAKINSLNSNIISLNDEIVNAKALSVDMHEKTKEKLKTLQEKYKTLSNDSEVLKDKFQEKGEQLNEALKNIKELQKTSSVESNDQNKIISDLRNGNNLLEDEVSNLKIKMKNNENEYSSQVGKLNKAIEENAILSNKYADIVKAKETEIEEYKDKLQTIQKEMNECQQEKVVLMGCQEELKQMTILKENAIQDKERILKESENQKEEMANALEKYKKENQKIFDIKAKDIYTKNENEIKEQKLKYKSDLKEKTSEFEKEISQYKSEISKLKQNLQQEMENNIQLEEKIEIMLKEKENMKKQMYENTMKSSVFPTRKQPQVAVLMTPKHPINMTPSRINVNSFKSKFLTSRKRKVVFNSDDDAMLVSDSDSSVSECQRNDKITIRTPLLKQHQKNINSPKEDNVSHPQLEETVLSTENQQNLENNISTKNRKTRILTGNNNKAKRSPVKQNLNNVKPKRTNVKKSEAQSVKKFFKSPKSKRSPASSIDKYAWFDMDSVFGFGSDD